MTTPRETQFATFAKLVVEDLREQGAFPMRPVHRSEARPLIERIIAKRAYDLAGHVVGTLPHLLKVAEQAQTVEEVLVYIPDLTVLPEPAEDASPAPPITCAVCDTPYVENVPGWRWYGYQAVGNGKTERYAFCSDVHLNQWKTEQGKA